MSKLKKHKPGLGKGLGALLPSIEFSDKGFKFSPEESDEKSGSFANIDVHKITMNPYQPRKDFDQQALDSLRDSIIEHGVISPITVRRAVHGYELVAGERRLRATIAAKIPKIPAFILDVETPVEMLELAIIENVQREDLNPIEVAYGYARLIEECHLTQEEVATRVAKDRSTVTNFLRLLRLPEEIQESVRKKEISMGHARALLGLSNIGNMLHTWKSILEESLSVRSTEAMVKKIEEGKARFGASGRLVVSDNKSQTAQKLSKEEMIFLEDNENRLRQNFGTKVTINAKSSNSGGITFEYYSKDELERLIDMFHTIKMS